MLASGVNCSSNLELMIAPTIIPTISIDQTIPTTLERLSSSDTSTNKAAKGVLLAQSARP